MPDNALVDVGAALDAGQNRRQRESLNALAVDAGKEQLRQSRKAFSDQERKDNTQFAFDSANIALQNPNALPGLIEEAKARGMTIDGFDFDSLLNDPDLFDTLTNLRDSALAAGAVEGGAIPDGIGTTEGFFNRNIADLTPEEQRRARDVELGIAPRAVGSGNITTATTPDLTSQVAESRGTITKSVETAKQKAQIAAIPEKVQVQFKADFKAGAQSRIRAANDAIARIDSVMEEAQLAIDDIGVGTTGLLGSINRKIAGTTAFALARKIDTIQANLSFDRIAEMRKNSPTGGALGQVSERELSLLGAAVVALDQANNEAEVKRAFTKILFHYNNWKSVLTGQNDADSLLNERDITEEQPDTPQQGAPTATGPNGEKLILQNGQWVSVSG